MLYSTDGTNVSLPGGSFFLRAFIKVLFIGQPSRYHHGKLIEGGPFMQTVYYTTSNFIRHTGNVVDLSEYRRKLAQAEGSLAPAPIQEGPSVRPFPHLTEVERPRQERAPRRLPRLSLDGWASVAVLVMTLTFTLRVLVF